MNTIDHRNLRLGKNPYVHSPTHFRINNYIPVLPTVPDTGNWDKVVPAYGMDANDSLGDCTCAGVDHMEKLWSYNAGKTFTSTDNDVIHLYSAVTGYNPNDPNTDMGANLVDCLKYWQGNGFMGHKILAYALVDPRNYAMVKAALYLFGGLYGGVGLPVTAQNQTKWTVADKSLNGDAAPYSWGGHCVVISEWAPDEVQCVTWGTTQAMDLAFFGTYFDELWAVISDDWLTANNVTPEGFDLKTLTADLQAVKSRS